MECRLECRMECRMECGMECRLECRVECRMGVGYNSDWLGVLATRRPKRGGWPQQVWSSLVRRNPKRIGWSKAWDNRSGVAISPACITLHEIKIGFKNKQRKMCICGEKCAFSHSKIGKILRDWRAPREIDGPPGGIQLGENTRF